MSRKRQSVNVFNAMEDHILRKLIAQSRSISHVFDQLKLRKSGASFRIFRSVVAERNIDTSHFVVHGDLNAVRQTRSVEDVFQKGNYVCNATLRNKVVKYNLLPYECQICKGNGEWMSKPLVLPLDHINGDRYDNRMENLRFLCPNCHAQTITFCGRREKVNHVCPDCSKPYAGAGRRCRECSSKIAKGVCIIKWPSAEEVHAMVWKEPIDKVAIKLGCSHTAIRKHCATHKINRPPMGYWERLRNGYTHEQALVSQKRVRNKRRNITKEQVELARSLMASGTSLREAAKTIGFSHSSLLTAFSRYPV